MAVQPGAQVVGGRTADARPPAPWRGSWTPAHSEAAVFVGECVAVGAVLGFLTELTRLVGEGQVLRAAPAGHGRIRRPGPVVPLTRRG
jgi:hypothetical protein